jgi:hypothetical protein
LSRLSRCSTASPVRVTHQIASSDAASQGSNQLISKPLVYAPRYSRTTLLPFADGAGERDVVSAIGDRDGRGADVAAEEGAGALSGEDPCAHAASATLAPIVTVHACDFHQLFDIEIRQFGTLALAAHWRPRRDREVLPRAPADRSLA